MDDQRVGRILRVLRHRVDMRQVDVARRADVTQKVVSLIERGHLDGLPLRQVRRALAAVGASSEIVVRWRGGEIDRVVDEAHAILVGATAELLSRLGWEVVVEVTYAQFGERGSIDLLAWHAATRTLLVIEVKSDLTSVEQLLRRHDVKVRLAPRIAADRYGWHPRTIARLLVLPAVSTARRRVVRHAAVLDRVYPLRADVLRHWLREPQATGGPVGGILFVSSDGRAARRPGMRKRVRRPKPADSTGDRAAVLPAFSRQPGREGLITPDLGPAETR